MKKSNKSIHVKIIDILTVAPRTRKELIGAYIDSLGMTREEFADRSTASRANVARSIAGSAINEMLSRGMIAKSADGIYTATDQRPVIIRKDKCESEILKMLANGPLTKSEIRKNLVESFGTARTVTDLDDNKLFSYMGDVLRFMVREEILVQTDGGYALAGKIAARINDISSILTLKSAFLSKLHSRGGEFFETYFMTLLGKYVTLFGKTVLSNSTTGGSADGGIDGIIETVDMLGFRETVMVQTKNRMDPTNETTARSFYGAVCARQGSRGIFATSSDFHPAAKEFLDSIDNCVGVDGGKIFEMAVKTKYGIKKVGDELTIDERII